MTSLTGVLFIRVARSFTVTNSVTLRTFFSAISCAISSWDLAAACSLFSFLYLAPKLFFLLSFILA